jgi:hypothetical protein
LDVDDDVGLAQLLVEARILPLQLFHFVCPGVALGFGSAFLRSQGLPNPLELVLVANRPAVRSTDLRDGEVRLRHPVWQRPPPLRAECALCIPRCRYAAGVGPRLPGPDARRPARLRPGLALHSAAARYARLRFVPHQPRPLRQHQENSCSSLFFSSSPCSLITTTGSVSEILARRGLVSSAFLGDEGPEDSGLSEALLRREDRCSLSRSLHRMDPNLLTGVERHRPLCQLLRRCGG